MSSEAQRRLAVVSIIGLLLGARASGARAREHNWDVRAQGWLGRFAAYEEASKTLTSDLTVVTYHPAYLSTARKGREIMARVKIDGWTMDKVLSVYTFTEDEQRLTDHMSELLKRGETLTNAYRGLMRERAALLLESLQLNNLKAGTAFLARARVNEQAFASMQQQLIDLQELALPSR
jgi:hypothetical protein